MPLVRRRDAGDARPGHVALERALSKLGHASRRAARALVVAGRVTVDGRVQTDPLAQVVPERASIVVDGQPVARRARRVIALHKPRGVLTTRRDPQGRRTVFELLGDAGEGLVAVGRLDLASSGLLLLTTNTRLADWLTDPRHAVPRRYVVTVRGELTDDDAHRLTAGVESSASTGVA
jgi:16S rRNA U516 pseudouridylate synthase RsuA-like enzyme